MYCGKVTKSLRSQKKEHQDIETGRGTAFDKLMNITDLAAYLDLPEATLYQWRYRREGPPSIKVGRHIRYRRSDVDAWLDSKTEAGSR